MSTRFINELTALLNKYSLENESDTPDFLLAQYVFHCLEIYATITKQRDKWFRFDPCAKNKPLTASDSDKSD